MSTYFNFITTLVCITLHSIATSITTDNTHICQLPPAVGICQGTDIKRYFYNKNTQKCDSFIYSGCGGNSNNFKDLKSCKEFANNVCNKEYRCNIKSPINEPYICYDTADKNPCSKKQGQSGINYFPSCTSCCHFIQCAELRAFDMPCAPGTGWDQNEQTCTHHAPCSIQPITSQPTSKPTQAPHIHTEPTSTTSMPINTCCGCVTSNPWTYNCLNDITCHNIICNLDEQCCNGVWDELCSFEAKNICLETMIEHSPNPTSFPTVQPTGSIITTQYTTVNTDDILTTHSKTAFPTENTNILPTQQPNVLISTTGSDIKVSTTISTIFTTENIVSSTENIVSSTENIVSSTENIVSSTENTVSSTENIVSSTENIVSSTMQSTESIPTTSDANDTKTAFPTVNPINSQTQQPTVWISTTSSDTTNPTPDIIFTTDENNQLTSFPTIHSTDTITTSHTKNTQFVSTNDGTMSAFSTTNPTISQTQPSNTVITSTISDITILSTETNKLTSFPSVESISTTSDTISSTDESIISSSRLISTATSFTSELTSKVTISDSLLANKETPTPTTIIDVIEGIRNTTVESSDGKLDKGTDNENETFTMKTIDRKSGGIIAVSIIGSIFVVFCVIIILHYTKFRSIEKMRVMQTEFDNSEEQWQNGIDIGNIQLEQNDEI